MKKAIVSEARLTAREFESQVSTLMDMKETIGGPVIVMMHVTPHITTKELRQKFVASCRENQIQVILDKNPLKSRRQPGSSRCINGFDTIAEFETWRQLSGAGFSVAELDEICKAFAASNEVVDADLLRLGKEHLDSPDRVMRLADRLYELLPNIESVRDPYDDPERWIGDGLDEIEEFEEEEHPLSDNYRKTLAAGVCFKMAKDKYVLVRSRDLIKQAMSNARWAKLKMKDIKERLIRIYGTTNVFVRAAFINLDAYKNTRYLKNLALSVPREKWVRFAEKNEQGVIEHNNLFTRSRLDGVSMCTSGKPGGFVYIKSPKRNYSALAYKVQPALDHCDVKRSPQSSVHFAVDMRKLSMQRKEYIELYAETDFAVMPLAKSSTQAIIAVPMVEDGFERLSNNLVCAAGNGVITSEEFPQAKYNACGVKSKGMQIYKRPLVTKKGIKVDAVFDSQGSRRLKQAFFGNGSIAMNAWLRGDASVALKQDITDSDFELVHDTIDGVPVVLLLGEMSIDVTHKGGVHIINKKPVYAQIQAVDESQWNEMWPLVVRNIKRNGHEVMAGIKNMDVFATLLGNIYGQARAKRVDIDSIKGNNLLSIQQAFFTKQHMRKATSYPEGLKVVLGLIDNNTRWQDSQLTKMQVEQILSAVGQPVVIAGVSISPLKYLIKYEGKVMVSPELRLIGNLINLAEARDFGRLWMKLRQYFIFSMKSVSRLISPEVEAISGPHATGAHDHGVKLPFEWELVDFVLKSCLPKKYGKAAREHIFELGIDHVNKVISGAKFKNHRDPVLDIIPVGGIEFVEMSVPVYLNGKLDALHMNGDDDGDLPATYEKQ